MTPNKKKNKEKFPEDIIEEERLDKYGIFPDDSEIEEKYEYDD